MTTQEIPSFTLPNGHKMPVIGFGTFQSTGSEVHQAVECAIEVGYRHIDTAFLYKNHVDVGKAIKHKINDGTVKREDLFITTKLGPTCFHSAADVRECLETSLRDLGLDYVDLFLIHVPFGLKKQTDPPNIFPKDEDGNLIIDLSSSIENVWKFLEPLVDEGKTRAIGVSNFTTSQMRRIMKIGRIPIASNQVECHAHFMRDKIFQFCQENNISFVAYGPIGAPYMGRPDPILLKEPVVLAAAEKYKKTPAQVLLRHLLQKGRIVIPKSVHKDRIKENFEIIDFKLSEEDVKILDSLKVKNVRLFGPGLVGCEKHPEYVEAYMGDE